MTRRTINSRLCVRPLEERVAPATFTVLNTLNAGAGSLRQAVLNANALAGADSIVFDPTAFAVPQTIILTAASITDAVTITGPAVGVTLNGNNSQRIFKINLAGAAGQPVSLSHVTLTNGNAVANFPLDQGRGGAIENLNAALSLDDVRITNCHADWQGGAIATGSDTGLASLTISNSVLTGNTAGPLLTYAHGGAIWAPGATVTITRTALTNNVANYYGAAFDGGTLTLLDSTVSGNQSLSNGSAIYPSGPTTIRGSTISANKVDFAVAVGNDILSIENSTIAFNSGIGICRRNGTPTITLNSTIVAKNVGTSQAVDIAATVTANHCLIGSTSGATITGAKNFYGDPLLAALANNGGPTQTHALLAGSLAIDTGSIPTFLTYDQRGTGYYRSCEGGPDMGAFEVQGRYAVITGGPGNPTNSTSAALTFIGGGPSFDHLESRLDVASFAAATSPQTITAIGEGSHTFQIRSVDAAGNTMASSGYSWNIDLTAPTASFTSVPPTPTKSTSATFDFTGSDPTSGGVSSGVNHLEYRLDSGSFITSTSSLTLTALAEGHHVLQVRSVDNAGNTSAVASYGWDIDTKSPTASIVTGPPSPTNSPSATFTFTGTDPTSAGVSSGLNHFEYKLDFGSFKTAASPLTLTSLAQGHHTFQVRAVDNAGNVGTYTASFAWDIDRTPPVASITAAPVNPANSTAATFSFGATDPVSSGVSSGVNHLEYALDGGSFVAGTSPQNFTGLTAPHHTFHVRAVDNAGNTGGAVGFVWDVDLTAPTVALNGPWPDVTTSGGTSYTMTVTVSDNLSVKVASLATGNLAVTGPNGFDALALFTGVDVNINGSPRVASFNLMPPGGSWSSFANGTYTIALRPNQVFDTAGNAAPAATLGSFSVAILPDVVSIHVNDGSAQRSRVSSLTAIFDSPVTLPANPAAAFLLKRQSDNASVALNASVSGNSVTLTFAPGTAVEFGSLADGRYTLTALASQINGGNFDGNGDGIIGDDYVLIGNPATNKLFRLFGDANGDGYVGPTDLLAFRLAFGGSGIVFDFNNDGFVGASDFIQFRLRFGGSI